MTRDEQIDRASIDWFYNVKHQDADASEAWEAGAKWADRTMLEKVFKYIGENLHYDGVGRCWTYAKNVGEFIEAIKRAVI